MDSVLEPIIETGKETFCVEIMKRLDCQRRNGHLCDVILEVGSGDDQAHLKAHRNVLCAASPFFYNALNTEMKEKEERVIRLKNLKKDLMEEVLEYFYTGHINVDDLNDKEAIELMAAADYFLVTSLKLLSSKFIQETLNNSNCLLVYYSSVKYQCSELQEAARKFILANFVAVTKSDDFLNLSMEQVEEWISSDEIVVKSEEEVFLSVLIWTEKNINERKQSFFDLFRHVRCLYVPRNFLITVILQHDLVRGQKECLDLVLDSLKELSDETGTCVFKQSPRNCLDTLEDVVFAFGGKDGNKAMCYLPSQNKWFKIRDMQYTRNPYAFATSTYQGKLYVIGGNLSHSLSNKQAVECYDPLLNTWSSIRSFQQEITFTASVTFQGFLYVIGGIDSSKCVLSAVKRYDSETNLWQEVSPLNNARSSICVVADKNYIYAIGGYINSTPGKCLDIVERFDPKFNSWNRIAPTQAKRRNAAGVSLESKIFVFGGVDLSGGCPCEVYDKETNVWTEIESDIAPKYSTSAVRLQGQIFVFSRFGENQNLLQEQTLKVYNTDKNEWKPCSNASLGSLFYRVSAGKVLKEVLLS